MSRKARQHQQGMERLPAPKSDSSASDSSISINMLSVTLDTDKCGFLGIGVVAESRDKGAGVYIGSVVENGAVAADGRVRAGDVLIRVNEVNVEKATSSQAVQVLRDAFQKPGPLSLTLLRFWEPPPDGLFTLPRGEPVRPIDPASWVSHTAAVTGKLLPPYGEDEHLSVDGDMAAVVTAMIRTDSGVVVRDRTWLKVVIPDAFTGKCMRRLPCRAVPCRAVPCRAVPCRAAPCRAAPCRAVPLPRKPRQRVRTHRRVGRRSLWLAQAVTRSDGCAGTWRAPPIAPTLADTPPSSWSAASSDTPSTPARRSDSPRSDTTSSETSTRWR
ncbi:segment polarity protein dishevelled homolog DVL-3-like [Syngnathus typhle]